MRQMTYNSGESRLPCSLPARCYNNGSSRSDFVHSPQSTAIITGQIRSIQDVAGSNLEGMSEAYDEQ